MQLFVECFVFCEDVDCVYEFGHVFADRIGDGSVSVPFFHGLEFALALVLRDHEVAHEFGVVDLEVRCCHFG